MNTKTILLSKTFWLQVITLLSLLIPAVDVWVHKNPEQFVAVWAALNVIVRFVTSGKVSLISEDATGMARLMMLGGTAAALMTSLPSCASLASLPITGTLSFRDAGSGAKASLTVGNEASRYKAPKARPIYAAK
jgi:hypothetical protein